MDPLDGNISAQQAASIAIPPKYAVRDYLKQQARRMEALSSDTTDSLLDRWTALYHGTPTSDGLRSMAEEYKGHMQTAGAFSLQSHHVASSRVSPYREGVTVSGFLLEPVGLGQGWVEDDVTPYVENAVLLRTVAAQFRRKKARVGVGMGGVVLTQHLLERVYERDEIELSSLRSVIESEFAELLRALALMEFASLWIEQIHSGATCRVTAVPYSNGLMIANRRFLFGNYDEGNFGFRLEIPSGRTLVPFVNQKRVVDKLGEGYFHRATRPVITICGITYMNSLTLTTDESDYFYGFKALMNELGDEVLDALSYFAFAPTLPHQERREFVPEKRELLNRIGTLTSLLNSGWLKVTPGAPICYLIPYPSGAKDAFWQTLTSDR